MIIDREEGGGGGHFTLETLFYFTGFYIWMPFMAIVSAPVISQGVGTARAARAAYKQSSVYRILSYVKRPINTYAAEQGVTGAATLLKLRKTYGWVTLSGSLYQPFTTLRLLSDRDWDRATVNWCGPAGSLMAYDWLMSRHHSQKTVTTSEDAVLPAKHRGRSGGTKTSSRQSYTPKRKWQCRKGYKYDPKKNLCVKALKKK